MNVAAILKEKGGEVIIAPPNASLAEIARILDVKGVGAVVLVDEEENIAGIISERDIVKAVARSGPEALSQPAYEHMNHKVLTCRRHDTLEMLMAEMTAHRCRHWPVTENGRLVGLVSIGDVVKHRIAEAEMEAEAMRDYIAS